MTKYGTSLRWDSKAKQYYAGVYKKGEFTPVIKERPITTKQLEKYYRMSIKERIKFVRTK